MVEKKNKGGRPKGVKNCGRCRKTKKYCKCGRPTKLTPETIKKLEEAFSLDCSIPEASFYAGISPATYHTFVKKEPKYLERFKALRNKPVLVARQSVVKGMQQDAGLALKYLERKKKGEFSPRQEVTGEEGKDLFESITIKIDK